LLFHQSNIIEIINSYSFDWDDQDISDMNHYFAKKIPNFRMNNHIIIMNNIHLTEKLNNLITIKENELEWNQRDIEKYHRDHEFFLELILLSMNFIYKETEREEEILSIQYKNSMNNDHNILIDDEQIQIIMKYHKSQIIMNDLKILLIYFQLKYRELHDLFIWNWIICWWIIYYISFHSVNW
jgi:hypothetical protein